MSAYAPIPLFYRSGPPLPLVDRAQGIRLWDVDGKEYIDGCSGSMICNIGHGEERVLRAMREQGERVSFAYRTHFNNQPSLDLARRLVELTPDHLERVFFVSGGSEAVETAMKLCRQYFYNTGQPERSVFIARTPAYHGATLGALALTSYAPLEDPFRPLIQEYPKIPAPYCYRCPYGLDPAGCGLECARALETTILEQGPENVAAFVCEPVTGSSVGALVPPDGYFDVIQETCTKYGVMLILDEVMCGYGRTGRLFGFEHWGVRGDIVAMSKGMGSGYFPLGGVMTSNAVAEAVLGAGGFQHGHTHAGNPMACAVGRAVLEVMEEDGLVQNAAEVGAYLKQGLRELAARHAQIGQVRGRGMFLALEFVADRETRAMLPPERQYCYQLATRAYGLGLFIYPHRTVGGRSGDQVQIAPPLITTRSEAGEILDRLDAALTRERP